MDMDMAGQNLITPAEAAELKDAFNLFDMDGNGTISACELKKVMRALGQNPTEKEVDEILQKADVDKSGSLSYDEYVTIINSYILDSKDVEIQLIQAFLVFDRDKSGTLNVKELQDILQNMGEPLADDEVKYVLKKIDTNNDGVVDVREFVAFLLRRV